MYKQFICLSIFFFSLFVAQSQLSVSLHEPPSGVVQKSQLWNITLIWSANTSTNVTIGLSLFDNNANQPVMTAFTRPVSLVNGVRQLRASDVEPAEYNYFSPAFDLGKMPDAFLPVGSYCACYTVYSGERSNKPNILSEDCFNFDVDPLSPPQLNFPADSAVVETRYPQFRWLPPTPVILFNDLNYDLLVTEVQQTASVTSMVNPILSGKLKFDTASKVINASATEFKEKWLVDNDIFNHFRLVTDSIGCTSHEVPDSLGYLEKIINPYRKGLIGNFRPYRSMVFYDTRKEYDTTSSTNLSVNGYLNNFKPYWDFNGSSNLVPDSTSSQWVWNNKLNKTNAKGLEVETVDALGIFTSAQYAYNKTIPVAIANNARYSEMFAEGFEDYAYSESVNNTSFNFFNRHINFNGVPNSSIINTDTTNFKAHTGRYVLKVNGSSTSSLSIPVVAGPDSTSSPVLVYQKDTTGVLSTLGGNYSFESTVPKSVPTSNQGTASFSTTSPGLSLDIQPLDTIYPSGIRMHYYNQSGSFYINLTTSKTYSFNISLNTAYNNNGITVNVHTHTFVVSIYDSLGSVVSSYTLSQDGFNYTSATYTAFLCPGTYLVSYGTNEIYNAGDNGLNYTHNSYSWSCSNSTSPDYKNLTKTSGCIYTHPLAALATMQNPLFSIPAGKKMFFSGWVHENCGDPVNGITCRDSTFTYNRVQLNFGAGANYDDTLYPTGPIIDGWQKYEGSFTAPSTSTSMALNLVNTGPATIYFDDIRIHPFNSNLKSYVYDPVTLRLQAELDANNYATFYDYDEEGTLIRTKVETREGIKTVTETRSFLQRVVH